MPMIHCHSLNGKPVVECRAESFRFCDASGNDATLRGDDTGAILLHVYSADGQVFADADPVVLLDHVKKARLPLSLSSAALARFLALGVVPLPGSIFKETMMLGIGDRVRFQWRAGAWAATRSMVDFPYYSERSREDQAPDPKRLHDLLCAAVQRSLPSQKAVTLMLSSGKDSTALAIALAALGRRNADCITFVTTGGPNEANEAGALCRKLGLKHRTASIPDRQPVNGEALTRFFENAPLPCADDCQLPYWALTRECAAESVVLDGSGNDVYMGHVPSRNDRWRRALRLRNAWLAKQAETLIPYGTMADQFLRSPAQLCLMQGLFRPREIRRIFPQASDMNDDIFGVPVGTATDLDAFDYRALVRGRHHDQGSSALKMYSACHAAGLQPQLPWCDPAMVAYYFHLPRKHRFDQRSFTNKLLLREMLRLEIGYPDRMIGKKYFRFDRIPFFMNNEARVKDEILACPLWERRASAALLEDVYRRLPRNARVGVALNAWFLLSGWLNHNRWLTLPKAID
jgi:asparagine synthase (glutamine-hydrolysing)